MKRIHLLGMGALFLLLIAYSCKKETLTAINDIPPFATLTLSAEDTMQTLFFRSDSLIYGKVNMKPNTKYNYIIAIFDTSGLKSTLFSLTKDYYPTYEFSSTPNPVFIDSLSSNFHYFYNDSLLGSRYTRYHIAGSFTTPPVNSSTPIIFNIKAYDYTPSLGFLDIHGEVNSAPDEERWGWISL